MENRQIIKDELTKNECIYVKHKSGLDIFVCEMEGYSTVDALFGTKYGSVNTCFKTKADKEYTTVPEGIAHFLEHKLFENEDNDVFELYAKTGASANAYTSFDRTCYIFNCSENYEESLRILLEFVQSPYFTQETVDKEQGIIAQEINMCDDNPENVVFFNTLKCLYHNHPVRINIAGTIESIAKIDAELLYKCYNTFYNLNNMVLIIAGNVKVDEVLKIADEKLKMCENNGLETVFPKEPDTVFQKEMVSKMSVGIPIFNIGFKSEPGSGYSGYKAELEATVASTALIYPSTVLYKSMTEEGLINTTFSSEVFCGDGFFSVMFSGESEHSREVYRRICEEIERVKMEGIDRKIFENVKKSMYGAVIREFNGVTSIGSVILNTYFAGVSPFDSMKILKEMTYEDVMKCIIERFDSEKSVISIVEK